MPADKIQIQDESRGNWANKYEFLLSCLGYAIGIGNVWRFPYLCYRNGGGAFLVPYLLMLFLCGIPLFFLETSLGQFTSTGCITLFKICPLFKGAGFAIVVVNIICVAYYNVIIAYPLLFLANCFTAKLPWIDCDNSWNTDHCVKGGMYYLQLFDWYAASIPVILICFIEVFIVGWTYGVTNFARDLKFMIQKEIHWLWIISWKTVNPIILLSIFVTTIAFNTRITYRGIVYPDWSITLGWSSCAISILCIPVYMGYRLLYIEKGDLIDRIQSAIKPTLEWGPADKEHKKEWFKAVHRDSIRNATLDTDPYHQQFIQLVTMNT